MRLRPIIAVAALAVALAGCVHRAPPVDWASTLASAEPPVPPAPPAPPPVSPINRNLTVAASVWHLRAGLNVAALACRNRPDSAAMVAQYNAMLTAQKDALATAQTSLSAEYKATGGKEWQDTYDDAMTRLYNFFSQAQARDAFCEQAAQVLAQTPALTAATLPAFAAQHLRELDRPFAEMTARPAFAVAAAQPTGQPRPQLSLDRSVFTRP